LPAGAVLTAVFLTRYARRFGGEGTIVTLSDGSAFTAAHCVAAVDARPGAIVTSTDGHRWRVVRRWSPRGRDLLTLLAVEGRRRGRTVSVARLAGQRTFRPGVTVTFYGFTGTSFRARRAVVTGVTATRVVAHVLSRAGVRSGDSGGPVLVGGRLAGIVVARRGAGSPAGASREVVITRLDVVPLIARSRR